MIHSGILYCQVYTLPSVLFDSLAFEVRKGRSCDSLQVLNEKVIESQGKQLLNYDKALSLSQSSNSTLSALLNNAKNGQEILSMQFQKDLKEEKKRTRKWKGIALIGAFVIIIQAVAPN